MSTPLTDGINALTAYANEVTGASDTTLSDAVETLVAGYGGGSSGGSWEKKFSTEVNVSTTNTGMNWIANIVTNCTELYTTSDIIFIRIRDKAGKRSGYYYGADEYFSPIHNNVPGSRGYALLEMRCESNGTLKCYNSTQGLWVSGIDQDGRLDLYTRYNASLSLTIDGTYAIDVYELKGPNGETPYAA